MLVVSFAGLRRAGCSRTAAPACRRAALVAAGLTVGHWLLLLQYQVFMKGLIDIAPYPHGWTDMWVTRFVVPFRIVARWMS
jgi:hypothetical protein